MSFLSDIRSTVEAMFASDLFCDAVLTRVTTVHFDPVKSTVSGRLTTDVPCRAVMEKLTIRNESGANRIASFVTLNVEPQSGDEILIDDGENAHLLTVGEVTAEAPHGTPLYWRAEVVE